MARIVLGVTGGIAAYKSCYLLRRLAEDGHDVTVVPTRNALEFVGKTTWEALSGNPVAAEVWDRAWQVPHVSLGREAELVVVAPATADLLARAAAGRADDLLTNVLLTATSPVIMVPAMHTEMWRNAATTANVATLRSRGVIVMEPASGRLTGPDSGPGRMPEPDEIAAFAEAILESEAVKAGVIAQDCAGLRVLVSAGGTHEALDPVRFLGNASSGKMGLALARAARQRGAKVHLVAANTNLAIPAGVEVTRVVSTEDLAQAMAKEAARCDIIVMAAAPADFTPDKPAAKKIKKDGDGGLTLTLKQTTDVLAALSKGRSQGQVVAGFAAETAADADELLRLGRAKLARKGCQLLVLNNVSGGQVFGAETNDVTILSAADDTAITASGSKDAVAHAILDAALAAHR
jgi:phosphopantothenoylcysteine decarboxylase/phosphopantothenate--cysteine ligase